LLRALKYIVLAGFFFLAVEAPKPFLSSATPVSVPIRVAYGPSTGFETLDLELIGQSRKTIDMAAYVLSDQRVIEALSAAASRNVRVRLYLDPEQFRRAGGANDNILALIHQPNVSAKMKAEQNDIMHLKSYAVDGRWLRTGSTNFSWSGETRQDNDVVIIDSPEAAGAFAVHFEKLWARRVVRKAATLAVVGAGAWGTALAISAARSHAKVWLWAHDPLHVEEMRRTRRNDKRLPGVAFALEIEPVADIACVGAADHVLAVVPAQCFRRTALAMRGHLRPGAAVVNCAKGIEQKSGLYMHEVLAEALPGQPAAVLSGPSFAVDLARDLPTAVTLAAQCEGLAAELCARLAAPNLRLYRSSDLKGVEIGGAAKNVLAIACGIAMGRKLGASAHAALLARGFAELMRFATAQGARPETVMGLSGLGDLALTCSSPQSRNFSLGFAIGGGEKPQAAGHGKLTEGALTAHILMQKARSLTVEMPIADAVTAILEDRIEVGAAIDGLMSRPFKAES